MSCLHCHGTFSKKTFYRHLKKCDKNPLKVPHPDVQEEQGKRKSVLKSNSTNLIAPLFEETNILNERIIDTIQKDHLGLIAINDPLIRKIASQFLANHREKKDEYSVTKKMRDAARLLLECQKQDSSITKFQDLLKPTQYPLVMKCFQTLSKFDESTGIVEIIGMPARLTSVVLDGAKIVSDSAILSTTLNKTEKEDIKVTIQEFLQVFNNQTKYYISSNAEKSRKKKPQRNLKLCLMMMTLKNYLNTQKYKERIA